MISEQLQQYPVVRDLQARLGEAITGGSDRLGQLALTFDPARVVNLCRILKEEMQFVRLSGITAVDWTPEEPRFEVVYLLHSLERNERLRMKCRLPGDNPEIDSVTGVWRSANWYERETFDMFGIKFRNHPNPRRILMPDDWDGHPLRKDYPIHGYKYTYQNE